jgi:hypothetical protein
LLLFKSMGWDYASELRPPTCLLFIHEIIHDSVVSVEWYWQGKAEELREKAVPVQLCPHPHRLTQAQTLAIVVTGRRLKAWPLQWPYLPLRDTVSYIYLHYQRPWWKVSSFSLSQEFPFHRIHKPNIFTQAVFIHLWQVDVVVVWLTLLLRIREIPGSHLDSGDQAVAGVESPAEWGFSCFFLTPSRRKPALN